MQRPLNDWTTVRISDVISRTRRSDDNTVLAFSSTSCLLSKISTFLSISFLHDFIFEGPCRYGFAPYMAHPGRCTQRGSYPLTYVYDCSSLTGWRNCLGNRLNRPVRKAGCSLYHWSNSLRQCRSCSSNVYSVTAGLNGDFSCSFTPLVRRRESNSRIQAERLLLYHLSCVRMLALILHRPEPMSVV